MQSELGVVVYVDLHGVLAEFLADRSDLLGEGGGEHHDLLLVGGCAEDLLDVAAHVEVLEDAVALVHNKMLDLVKLEALLPDEVEDPAGSSDDDVRGLGLEDLLVELLVDSSVEDGGLDFSEVFGEALVLMGNLEGELAGVAEDEDGDLVGWGWG